MTRLSRRLLTMALLLSPLLAWAEGKCDDDPRPYTDPSGKKILVVGWTIPYPAGAQVDPDADGKLIADLDKLFGAELPPGFPADHSKNHFPAPYPAQHAFDKKVLADVKAIEDHDNAFGTRLEPEAKALFADYNKRGRHAYARVVQHPKDEKLVPDDGLGFRFCTCTLQRGVALWKPVKDSAGEEHLWVRSRFRSARDPATFVNFTPSNPVKFTFPSDVIWFPLTLNKVIPEPGISAFLLLDVLTKEQLDATKIPPGYNPEQAKKTFRYDGADWYVTRLWREFKRSGAVDDLSIQPKFVAP